MWVPAGEVARAAVSGMDANRAVVIPGAANRIAAAAAWLSPAGFWSRCWPGATLPSATEASLSPGRRRRSRLLGVVVSGTLDVASILAFVVIGRSSHDHGVTVAGVVDTSWPFLAGAAVGWAVGRAWRSPAAVAPVGVVVWISCVGVGMALRVLAGQGTAAAFVVVALVFLGSAMLGWRLLAGIGAAWARARAGQDGVRYTDS